MAQARQGGRARGAEMAGFLVGTAGLTALWLALPLAAPAGPDVDPTRDAAVAPAADVQPGDARPTGASAQVAARDPAPTEPGAREPAGAATGVTTVAGVGEGATPTVPAVAAEGVGSDTGAGADSGAGRPPAGPATSAPEPPTRPSSSRLGLRVARAEHPAVETRAASLPILRADGQAEAGTPGAVPEAGTSAASLHPPADPAALARTGTTPRAESAPDIAAGLAPGTATAPRPLLESAVDPGAVAGVSATPGPAAAAIEVATGDAGGARRVVLGDGSSADGVTIRRIGAPPASPDPLSGPATVTPSPDDAMPGASTADTASGMGSGTVTATAAPDAAMPAWIANAAFWASLDPARPPFAVVLIDDGTADVARLAAALPGPVSVALDPRLPDLAPRAAAWRAAGAEVLVLAALPPDATAADAAVVYQASAAALPEAVALLDAGSGGLAGVGDVARLGRQEAEARGLGVVLPPAGFVTRPRDGGAVPTVALIRDVDGQGQDARAIARFLDDSARRAIEAGGGAVLARATPESVTALASWLGSTRGQAVQVAPVSALFAAGRP